MNTTASLAPPTVAADLGHRHAFVSTAHGVVSQPVQDGTDGMSDHDGIRHAHRHEHEHESGHGHSHDHEHVHSHGHAHGVEAVAPGFSLVRASLTVRLAIAGGTSLLIWGAVFWAVQPIVAVTP